MKTLLVAACVMWMTLAVELASPGILPHGSLLLPVACWVIIWTRSTGGLVLSGVCLLLDWIARPTLFPLCPMILPLMAVLAVAPSLHHEEYRSRVSSLKIPVPLHLPMLTLAAIVLHVLGSTSLAQMLNPQGLFLLLSTNLKSLAIIALPVSAVASLLIRLADEFGLRRSFSL